jgi:hypothetical protein
MHHREPREQAVGVVVAADPHEVVQSAVRYVSAGERLEPSVGLYQVTVEVRPERPLPPTLRFAKPKMDIRRDADETKDSRVEAELFLEHA